MPDVGGEFVVKINCSCSIKRKLDVLDRCKRRSMSYDATESYIGKAVKRDQRYAEEGSI
jgi:hypothetical protein